MKTLTLILFAALILAGCKKTVTNPALRSQATITGYDMRKCASPGCGGLLITIKNDTAKNPRPYYQINSTLAQLGISESTKFPIYVDLTWKPDTGVYGTFHYIVVTYISIVK
ncbi:MAG: hypothetical protein ACXVJG_12665 [Mucilaginibacter sp.]